MKTCFRILSGIIAVLVIVFGITIGIVEQSIPDSYKVIQGQELDLQTFGLSAKQVMEEDVRVVSMNTANMDYETEVRLFDVIPIKKVQVQVANQMMLIPCGTPFGIKMFTNGVVVVGMSDIMTDSGYLNPAIQAGLKIGDI